MLSKVGLSIFSELTGVRFNCLFEGTLNKRGETNCGPIDTVSELGFCNTLRDLHYLHNNRFESDSLVGQKMTKIVKNSPCDTPDYTFSQKK